MEEFNYKKKYGQNFLQDQNILNKIANLIPIAEDDLIIEIGPGNGKLTASLVKHHSYYLAYEIDKDVKKYLDKYINDKVQINYQDFLTADINEDIKNIPFNNLYIIANIPYYITTPILTKIINSHIPVSKQVIMVQKEMARRLAAAPGSKLYGRVTAYLNCYCRITKMFDVPRSCFKPIPNVDSSVLLLEKDYKMSGIDEQVLHNLIRDAFQFKRKQLKNNLKAYDLKKIESILKKYNLDLTCRAEEISIEIFIDIVRVLGHK